MDNEPQWPTERHPWPGPQHGYGQQLPPPPGQYQRPYQHPYDPRQGQSLPVPYQPQHAQGYGPQHPPQQPYRVVVPRNTFLAVLASFFVPGLGSMINGKIAKGILILSCYLISWLLCFFVVGFILFPACWIWGMIAGARDARKWNTAHGIIS